MIDSIWGKKEGPSEDKFNFMVWIFGCYVAVTIDNHYVGEWQRNDDGTIDFISNMGGASPYNWLAKRFDLGDLIYPKYSFSIKTMEKKVKK